MFEFVMALNVTNDTGYQAYRDGMTPILTEMGGCFRYDFRIGETLKNASDHPINRVFAISFPDEQTSQKFFADPGYLEVRARHFDASVAGVTKLGENQSNPS